MTLNATFEEQNTVFDATFDDKVVVGYDKGFADGQNSVQNPLEYAQQVIYTSNSFPEGYELTIDMPNIVNMSYLLTNTKGIRKATIKGNTDGKALNFEGAFSSKSLEILDLTDFILNVENGTRMFYYAEKLRKIKGNFDIRNCTSATDPFRGCGALEEIRFLPLSVPYILPIPDSPLLSAETRQSIVEALMPVGGVLKLHADVTAKFTPEQILEITNKNWRVV